MLVIHKQVGNAALLLVWTSISRLVPDIPPSFKMCEKLGRQPNSSPRYLIFVAWMVESLPRPVVYRVMENGLFTQPVVDHRYISRLLIRNAAVPLNQ